MVLLKSGVQIENVKLGEIACVRYMESGTNWCRLIWFKIPEQGGTNRSCKGSFLKDWSFGIFIGNMDLMIRLSGN